MRFRVPDTFQSLIGRLVTRLLCMEAQAGLTFQSLIGRLVTRDGEEEPSAPVWFQSLIGRLVTQLRVVRVG
ncbi:MAG: hypothetical protein NZ741_12595 [Armatimonadetes bacterium]|nr:hypothetical protein [Armatimonadota bacterium]